MESGVGKFVSSRSGPSVPLILVELIASPRSVLFAELFPRGFIVGVENVDALTFGRTEKPNYAENLSLLTTSCNV